MSRIVDARCELVGEQAIPHDEELKCEDADIIQVIEQASCVIAAELGETFEKASFSDEAPAVRLAWVENLTAEALPARLDVLEGLVAEDPDPAVRAAALGRLSAAGEAAGFDELLVLAHTWRSDELADARGAALAAALTIQKPNSRAAETEAEGQRVFRFE